MGLIEMIYSWLTFSVEEEELHEFEAKRSIILQQIGALVQQLGYSILGAGLNGIVVSNGYGQCTKYTLIPLEVGDDNEVTNSYLAAGLGLAPYINGHAVLKEDSSYRMVSIEMEELEGVSLCEYILDGNDWSWVIAEMNKLTDYMHEEGLVHKDLHQFNIWVTPDKELKFIDWGRSSSSPQSVRKESFRKWDKTMFLTPN